MPAAFSPPRDLFWPWVLASGSVHLEVVILQKNSLKEQSQVTYFLSIDFYFFPQVPLYTNSCTCVDLTCPSSLEQNFEWKDSSMNPSFAAGASYRKWAK